MPVGKFPAPFFDYAEAGSFRADAARQLERPPTDKVSPARDGGRLVGDTSTSMLGETVSMAFGLGPVAMTGLEHSTSDIPGKDSPKKRVSGERVVRMSTYLCRSSALNDGCRSIPSFVISRYVTSAS
jgi:hypothetical protein